MPALGAARSGKYRVEHAAGGGNADPAGERTKPPIVLNHWSYLTASDGDVWARIIDEFNRSNSDIQIKMTVMTHDEYNTKALAGVATGQAPDFGWDTGGLQTHWIKDGVIVRLDDLASAAGLDLTDFTDNSLRLARYPNFDNGLYLVPMDAMAMAQLINVNQATGAGLDVTQPPTTGEAWNAWMRTLTRYDDQGNLNPAGMTMGTDFSATDAWGIVAYQMGFRRTTDDLKTACVNPEAGTRALRWLLDTLDTQRVATREINANDIYKDFTDGHGSSLWIGPWVLSGFTKQLNLTSAEIPLIGTERHTYLELGGLQVFTQRDTSRYAATMKAIKWLSDNSFEWTTVGRGGAARKSILARPDYLSSAGTIRKPFIDALQYADIGPVPVTAAADFSIYSGSNVLYQELSAVLTGSKPVETFMPDLCGRWQTLLDQG